MSEREPSPASSEQVSFHVRGAMAGQPDSQAWIIEHFTPLLELQARYRLKEFRGGWCAPEDLVQDVWAVALPRLPHLTGRGTRWTPVLVKFLGTTLLHKTNKVLRRYIRDRQQRESAEGSGDLLHEVPAQVSSVLSQASRRERIARVRAAIDALEPIDREILVLRGIEQQPNVDVGRRLDLQPAAVSMRFRRALERLSQELPDSVFADMLDD